MRHPATFVIVMLLSLTSCAVSGPKFVAETPPSDQAVIYIYRTSSIFGAANTYSIFADGKFVCTIWNGEYCKHVVAPGTIAYRYNSKNYATVLFYAISSIFDDTNPAGTVQAEAGKEYFVRANLHFVGMTLDPTPSEQALKDIAGLVRYEPNAAPSPSP